MYTLVISSYWYIMHIVLLLLGVKPSIFCNSKHIVINLPVRQRISKSNLLKL